jgi:uncharacterized protein (DUF952 family)
MSAQLFGSPRTRRSVIIEQVLFHITTRAAWDEARERGEYRPASLETEGFIHLSEEWQWRGALERFFRGQTGLVLLHIDAQRLRAPVRYERADGDAFPHLYGALELDAVVQLTELASPV